MSTPGRIAPPNDFGLTACVQAVDASGLIWAVDFAVLTLPLFWTDYTFSRLEGSLLLGGSVACIASVVFLAR